ncbi:MAG: ATPase, T2SS/T4P/T4SS family, partial [Akkermansia muciniphila]
TQDLVDFLIQANYLTEDVIAQVAASNSLLPVVDLGSMHIPQEVRELITPELARRFRAIPISDDGFSINIAIDDPLNLDPMASLPQLMGRDVIFSVATRSAESRLNEFTDLSVPEETDGWKEDAPIIRLVQQMLTDAFKMRASDIHIEPAENRFPSLRVTASWWRWPPIQKLLSPIIARLKVMSTTMSIAEKRMPQDGRIR